MTINQTTFINGMDFIAPDFAISANGYKCLINARQRLGYIEANPKPLKSITIPAGKKQGLIGIGNILIVFIAGNAYYNVDGTSVWVRISGFNMDVNADRYWAQAVPEGTVRFARKLNADGNISSPINKSFDFAVNGTPAAIVVQDNINQPSVIIFDTSSSTFSARKTQTYDEWINDGVHQEYVPIGNMMLVVDQKLYIISQDYKNIYQSISGRYLDFMVNVDNAGNKLLTEALGGATSVSFNFDADDITCIASVDVPSSFFYGTARNVRIISLDYTNTIFGEPTYAVSALMDVGVVNQDSVTDILGDTAFINKDGVKSLNAVQQLKFQGRNSIFSLMLSKLLKKIKQTRCRAINFDNFNIFNLDTRYGNVLVIFDNILQKWVSIDITTVYSVKQFAIIELPQESKLYAINVLDDLYQLYADFDNRETGQLHTRALVAKDSAQMVYNQPMALNVESNVMYYQKSEYLKLFFQGGSAETTVGVTEYVDGEKSLARLTKTFDPQQSGLKFPLSFPMLFDSKPSALPIVFNFKNGKKGHKLSYIVQWSTDSLLQAFELKTSDEVPVVSKQQQEKVYGS